MTTSAPDQRTHSPRVHVPEAERADKSDRRVERSRAALTQAFVSLLFERGYAKVTVKDIIARADVGRSTFYDHFNNKNEVLRASLSDMLWVLAGAVDRERPEAELLRFVEHLWENRRLARIFHSGSATRMAIARHLADFVVDELVKLPANNGVPPLIPFRLAAHQIADMQLSVIENWLTGKHGSDARGVTKALRASSSAAARAIVEHGR